MPDGKGKSAEIEPTFNIDDWMKELLPDTNLTDIDRMERAGPSSSLNNPIQQNNPIKVEENYQVAASFAEFPLQSNIMPSMSMNSMNTSVQNNPFGGRFSNTPSTVFQGFSQNQTSCNMVSQFDQHQLLNHQAPAQFVERTNNYPSSVRLDSYLNNQRQKQQVQNLNTVSSMMQQQRSVMMRNQESCNVIQQGDPTSLEARLQQISRQVQMQQPLQMQSGLLSKLQASNFPHGTNFTLVNQIKSENQAQASLEPAIQVQMVNSGAWVDQAYHQILQLKSMFEPEVVRQYRKASELRNQACDSETAARCEKTMVFSEKIYTFLQMSKSDILCHGKETFYQLLNYVGSYLDRLRAKNSLHVQQQPQQAVPSFSQLKTPQLHQIRGNVPQSYGTSPTLSGPSRQQRTMSSEASPVSLFQVGSSAGAQNPDALSIMNTSRYNTLRRSTQQHSPRRVSQGSRISSPHNSYQVGFEQGSPVMPPHSSTGVSQQINFSAPQQKVTLSRNILNPLESSISPITRNSLLTTSDKNNCLNMPKSAQQLASEEHMQQMMQKKNYDSPFRHFASLSKNSSLYHVPSPQNSQHSSSLIEFSKSRTPSFSASPLAFPSPLNPLTPSSKQADSEKSSLSLEEAGGVPRVSAALAEPPSKQLQSTPLVPESSSPRQDDSSRDKGDAFKRLIDAVKNISSKALDASLRDIAAVVSITDVMTGSFLHGEPNIDIANHLADDTENGSDWNFRLMCETGMELRMKRQLDSIASKIETNCHSSVTEKRQKKEPNDKLLQEMKEINQKLIEVVVDAREGHDEGMFIVRCSYHPIGLNGNGSLVNTSPQTTPHLVLELIVTDDYPHSSPIIVETQPSSCGESEEGKGMWMKVMSNFSLALRKCPQPLSVKEMAKTWNVCARKVYRQFALQNGGGDFSSTYGQWETCVAAT